MWWGFWYDCTNGHTNGTNLYCCLQRNWGKMKFTVSHFICGCETVISIGHSILQNGYGIWGPVIFPVFGTSKCLYDSLMEPLCYLHKVMSSKHSRNLPRPASVALYRASSCIEIKLMLYWIGVRKWSRIVCLILRIEPHRKKWTISWIESKRAELNSRSSFYFLPIELRMVIEVKKRSDNMMYINLES